MNTVREVLVVLNSSRFGQGNPRLGESLMKEFLRSVLVGDSHPAAILLYNSAAALACKDSPVLETLKALEEGGCEILVNTESLEFYSLEEALEAGKSELLKPMTERMLHADLILKP